MKSVKHCFFVVTALLCSNGLFAQKDSVQALFNPPKFNIHYSYLQWQLGYNGFVFSNTYLSGIGLDVFGIVFNDDVDIAIGLDQGGRNGRTGYHAAILATRTLQSYAGFYIKAEPMLFPEKIINISTPLKFGMSSLSYADTSTVAATGYGRRRNRPISFFDVEPGFFAYVNVFPKVHFGVGASYRVALNTSSSISYSDYDNFVFSAVMRLQLDTHSKRKLAAKKNDYYTPSDRFQ